MKTWDDVCEFLETLPGVEHAPPGDRDVVRVKGKVLAFPATNARSRPPEAEEGEASLSGLRWGNGKRFCTRTRIPTHPAL